MRFLRLRRAAGNHYATVVGLIAVVALVAVNGLGLNTKALMGRVANTLTNVIEPAAPAATVASVLQPLAPAGAPNVAGGPATLYGHYWYLGTANRRYDQVCAAVSGTTLSNNLANSNACGSVGVGNISRWFYQNGSSGDFNGSSGSTSARSLGYGYAGNSHYGKCTRATDTSAIGTFPWEGSGGGWLFACPASCSERGA